MEWCCAWRRILMTSIGVTTATASVTPAARPAVCLLVSCSLSWLHNWSPLSSQIPKSRFECGLGGLDQSGYPRPPGLWFQPSLSSSHRSSLTKESSLRAHNAGLLIGHQLLIRLKRGESNRHLWNDTGGDGSESLVETQWSLALDDLGAGGDEAAGFDLCGLLVQCSRIDVRAE